MLRCAVKPWGTEMKTEEFNFEMQLGNYLDIQKSFRVKIH